MIEVNERIEVASAPRAVWSVLSDPHKVVECVPGAALGQLQEDGSYDATLTVKFGPAKVSFRARFTLELDAAAMAGRVIARGRDDQGGTKIRSNMTFRVIEQTEPPGSAIPIDAQVEIGGRLATLIEGGATLVVKRMTKEFSERLAERCASTGAAQSTC
jgi:carbon monoxide dehydrogenase subunit G